MTGFLCFYKKAGVSSFGAIAELRRIAGEKKLGHCGTLDPMATGVLPVAFGRASKFIELLPDSDKAYTAEFRLGLQTDTLDITGNVRKRAQVHCNEAQVRQALESFLGKQMQTPPMYSALSRGGVRLYELARQGMEIHREPRQIVIYEIRYLGMCAEHTYRIHVRCGKGTYIRSLIDDLGEKLGCGACLTALERTESNGFTLENAVTAEDAAAKADEGAFQSLLISVEKALASYPSVCLTGAQSRRFANGGALSFSRLPELPADARYRVYAADGSFLGVGERREEEQILAVKKLYAVPGAN